MFVLLQPCQPLTETSSFHFHKILKLKNAKNKSSHIEAQINTEAQMACYSLSRWIVFVYLQQL